jgi:hypothetical protein
MKEHMFDVVDCDLRRAHVTLGDRSHDNALVEECQRHQLRSEENK